MSEYRDVQSAVRVEKFRIWFAWVTGAFLMGMVVTATEGMGVLHTVAQAAWIIGGVAFTVTAIRMTAALNRKAERLRREVLGEVEE